MLNLKNLTQTPTTLAEANENEKKPMKNLIYKLYGVLVHLGHTSRSGHYYSYVKAPNDSWYRADDSRVNKVQLQEALSQKAYILFYKRVTKTPEEKQFQQTTQLFNIFKHSKRSS